MSTSVVGDHEVALDRPWQFALCRQPVAVLADRTNDVPKREIIITIFRDAEYVEGMYSQLMYMKAMGREGLV